MFHLLRLYTSSAGIVSSIPSQGTEISQMNTGEKEIKKFFFPPKLLKLNQSNKQNFNQGTKPATIMEWISEVNISLCLLVARMVERLLHCRRTLYCLNLRPNSTAICVICICLFYKITVSCITRCVAEPLTKYIVLYVTNDCNSITLHVGRYNTRVFFFPWIIID